MDWSGNRGFLPTVTFTSADATFTSAERIAQLSSIGITGFYEADFANNITTIDVSAFAFDSKVVVATINGVTSIRSDAFYGCTALRAITLDTSVNTSTKQYLLTDISSGAFQGCTSLINLHIPDTVKTISDNLCNGCTSLEVAVMGYGYDRTTDTYNRTARIGISAFANCSKLSYFIVPETVSQIGDSAFANDVSLALLTILGRPDISANAFTGAMTNTSPVPICYYDNSASYSNPYTTTSFALFPATASRRPYREIDLSAGAGTTLTDTHVNTATAFVTTIDIHLWKGKIRNTITSLADSCFRMGFINNTKYTNMIGLSLPPALTSIGYAAFQSSGICNVGGYYIPKSVTTFGFDATSLSGDTFAVASGSRTRQFVFQSGKTSPITTLPPGMFRFNTAMAIVIPSFTNIGASCFQFAQHVQYFNFFQKNAYTTLTKLDGATTNSGTNAFSNCFNAVTSRTHYLYIPKAVATISTSAFLSSTNPLFITAYSSTTDGSFNGLCAQSNYLTSTYFSGTVTPTIYLINNYYDANGLPLGTLNPTINYHVLFHPSIITPSITTFSNRFAGSTTLKSVVIPNDVTDIGASTFSGCTGLTNVLFITPTGGLVSIGNSVFNGCTALNEFYMNRVKSIGTSAFRNALLSNTFDLSGATSLETIYSAAFYTDAGYTSSLKQITIPSSVKVLGSRAFGSSAVGLKPSFTTLTFETGTAFWGDYDNTLSSTSTTASYEVLNTSSLKYMAIPANFCENCDYLTSVSFLNTVEANGDVIMVDVNSSGALVRPDNSAPITRLNTQTLSPAIKRIGTSAFVNNQRLQSIRIPDGVTTIDASGLYNAYSLSCLYLPDSLTTIGLDAFNKLGSSNKFGYTGNAVFIRIPQSRIDDVSNNMFDTSGGTKFFTVPFDNTYSAVTNGVLGRFTTQPINPVIYYNVVTLNGITGILGGTTAGARAFDGYTTLKSVTIADTVTDISLSAFSGCTGLVNVFISPTSNLINVGDSAFSGDVSLTSFFVPNSLRGISRNMFSGCTSLASVSYGNNPGIKYIDASGFATNKLTSIFIPSSVVSIGSQAFITSTTQNMLNAVTFGAGSRLKSIGGGCFGHATSTYAARYLKDIALPNSVRCIGTGLSGGLVSDATTSNVFRNAFTLAHSTNLILPSSLESLSNWFLFTDSSNVDISNVYLPKSITNVAGPRNHCGYTTSGLGGNEFSSTTIGSRAGSLLYLPSELSTYTASSFPGLNRARSYYKTVSYTTNPLTSLSLGGTVATTTDASNTTQIHADIKEGVTVIGNGTNNITSGGTASNLISVNIPSTVTDIKTSAFNGCSALAYVTFSENSHLTTIGTSAFSGCNKIQDIQLPDTLNTIGPYAFYDCSNLASISIPYNVTSISSGAFARSTIAKQLGNDIDGEASLTSWSGDQSGYAVAMNRDGTIVAIGANKNNNGDGQVRVYQYKTITDATWDNYNATDFSYNGISPYNKPIVTASGEPFPVSGKYYWVQMGGDINGILGSSDAFGQSVSLSSDGTTVAAGLMFGGMTRVFKYNGNDWIQLGDSIITYNDRSGSDMAISLSSDGTIIAIGAYHGTGVYGTLYSYRGDTRIYQYNGSSTWTQLGQNIGGEANSDYFGSMVSLSSDGTIVAIGAEYNDGTPFLSARGHVRVFKYQTITDTDWTNYNAINFSFTGISPYNKPIVAAGGDANPVPDKNYWVQMGADIDGEGANYSASVVSLSKDGTTVAIGGTYVRVYQYKTITDATWANYNATDFSYNGISPYNKPVLAAGGDANPVSGKYYWVQMGGEFDRFASNRDTRAISLSKNQYGTILAIGDSNAYNTAGRVIIFQYDSDKIINVTDQSNNNFGPIGWRRLGQDIVGEYAGDDSGTAISLSDDGTTIAIGAFQNRGRTGLYYNYFGHVRVYQINPVTVPVRLHQKLYNDISGSLNACFSGISNSSFQVIPALQLTNTLNSSKLTISQINNMYIRYRQSQLSSFTSISVSASSGGSLQASDITTALSSSTGFVHLDISTNVTSIAASACTSNSRIYSVAISNTVVTIGDNAFNGCTNLTYLSFHPDSVCTTLGQYAFGNASALSNQIFDLTLPDSLTTIGLGAFQNSNGLTSVCIPIRVTSLGTNAFSNCTKLTSVALPASLPLATYGANGTYFNTNGSTAPSTFTSYSATSAIPHFKLSDYSMPNGIVQNVVDSAVTYIDHLAYVYYPDITIYAVTTNQNTKTAGEYSYTANNVQTPITPAAYLLNGISLGTNSMFPIYRSVPDLNVFSGSSATADWPDNNDDYYGLMPGYSICIFNNLYDEENIFTDSPTFRYYDNEFGLVPLNITVPAGIANTTSSILILFNGRILSKYFAS